MKEEIRDYWKLNILPAIKEIRGNIKLNLCFIAAIFIIQTMMCIIFFAADNIGRLKEEHVRKNYDYHLVFRNLSFDALKLLRAQEEWKFKFAAGGDFNIVRVNTLEDTEGYPLYDVFITLTGDDSNNDIIITYNTFAQEFEYLLTEMSGAPGATLYRSPLYYQDAHYQFSTFVYYLMEEGARISSQSIYDTYLGYTVPYIAKPMLGIDADTIGTYRMVMLYSAASVFAAAFIILLRLFSIHINNQKYEYGLYLVFGADRRKLMRLALWEMLILGFITILPSGMVAALSCLAVFRAAGSSFFPTIGAFIGVLIWSSLLITAAMYLPFRHASRQTAVKLLATENNANYVSSPIRSSEFYHARFPGKYTAVHYWRFRKYYVLLLVSAVLCNSIFAAGLYCADVYDALNDQESPQFILNFEKPVTSTEYDTVIQPYLSTIEGIEYADALISTSAASLSSFVEFPSSGVRKRSGFRVSDTHTGYLATLDCRYVCADASQIKKLSACEGMGDVSELTADGHVVVTESKNGQHRLSLKEGDTIYLAMPSAFREDANLLASAGDNMLDALQTNYHYQYIPYTVSAVLYEDIADDGIRIYLPADVYQNLTGSTEASLLRSHAVFPAKVFGVSVIGDILADDPFLPDSEINEILKNARDAGAEIFDDGYGREYVYNNLTYTSLTNDLADRLAGQVVDGNLDYVLAGDHVVAVTVNLPSLYTEVKAGCDGMLGLSVGDTFRIGCVKYDGNTKKVTKKETEDDIPNFYIVTSDEPPTEMALQIESLEYEYVEYTVGAVLYDDEAESPRVYFNSSVYTVMTGVSTSYDHADIYINREFTPDQADTIFYALRNIGRDDTSVTNQNSIYDRVIENHSNYSGFIRVLSVLLLFIPPMMWLYMQTPFYQKRRTEFEILAAFGASRSQIKKLFLWDASVLAGLSVLVYSAVSVGVMKLTHLLVNRYAAIPVAFVLPWQALLIGLVLCIAGAYLSVMLPYFFYVRSQNGCAVDALD